MGHAQSGLLLCSRFSCGSEEQQTFPLRSSDTPTKENNQAFHAPGSQRAQAGVGTIDIDDLLCAVCVDLRAHKTLLRLGPFNVDRLVAAVDRGELMQALRELSGIEVFRWRGSLGSVK